MEKKCDCGSGLYSEWIYDARGIEVCRACIKCEKEKTKGYRQDIFTDPNYWTDEPVESDDY